MSNDGSAPHDYNADDDLYAEDPEEQDGPPLRIEDYISDDELDAILSEDLT